MSDAWSAAGTAAPPLAAAFAAELEIATRQLAATEPLLCAAIERFGACGLAPHWQRAPFEALLRTVAHQQLRGVVAEAILARFLALYPDVPFPSAAEVAATDPERLRAVGFSRSKVAAIQAIAAAASNGVVPSREEADQMPDEALVARLVPLRGIGRWTVEMLMIFTLGRLDILPLDDFGVRSGLRAGLGLADLPSRRALAEAGEPWRPYRSVASWYLWQIAGATPAPRLRRAKRL